MGYGFFWILDYGSSASPPDDPASVPAARRGHGDGLLMATLGLELFSRSSIRLLLEYTYLRPVIDDPGDNFAFASNHIFQAGLRF